MKQKLIAALIAIGIFLLAAFFRFYGVNWDANQHLHPDERFLTMVTSAIAWPKSITEYLDTQNSPLNPHNKGFSFFVYGTFPIFFTKWVSEYLGKTDYNNLTLIGRQLSALFDLGTVLLVFLIARQITKSGIRNQELGIRKKNSLFIIHNSLFPLFAMFFYAASVLPIQLSHFYAVDTYLTFFITLSFYLLIKIIENDAKQLGVRHIIRSICLGIALGLAAASKISTFLFLPIIALGLIFFLIKKRNIVLFIIYSLLCIIGFFFTFRLTQPYLFVSPNVFDITLNPKVLDNWKQLKSFDGPNTGFPPALQWIPTKPFIYPLTHLLLWGLGLPMGIISILAVSYYVLRITYYVLKMKIYLILTTYYLMLFLSLLWILLVFFYQGAQFAKALRYFYPIYPFLAIISGYFVNNVYVSIYSKFKLNSRSLYPLILVSAMIMIVYPVAFVSIYSRSHARVSASTWIYKNLPKGSTIGNEHWDDPQPLYNTGGNPSDYNGVMLSLYDPDTPEKWEKISKDLEKSDYIILTSNRLWRSLSALPKKYPYTGKYYQLLFDGSLGFDTIAVFSSYPCLIPKLFPSAGNEIIEKTNLHPYPISLTTTNYCLLALNDDGAEESFTVYDHPKVIIFKNNKHFSAGKLLNIITNTN